MFQFLSYLGFIIATRWRWITYTCIAILSSIFEASYPVTTSNVFLWEASNKCTFCTTRIGESFHWRGILWSISREKDGTLLWRRTVRNESVRRGDALTGVWHRDNWTVPPHLDIRWSGHALLWYNRWSTSCKYVHESAESLSWTSHFLHLITSMVQKLEALVCITWSR